MAVADTLAVMPTLCAAGEVGQLRWWQVRRAVEAAWRLTPDTQTALDTHLAALAEQGRLRGGFAATLNRLVIDLDPELAERSLADALAERAVTIRPDQDVAGIGRLTASLPAEGAITVAAGLDRLADTALSQPPAGLPVEGRTADNRRADALVGLLACVLDALDADADAQVVADPDPADPADPADRADRVGAADLAIRAAVCGAEVAGPIQSGSAIGQTAGDAPRRPRLGRRGGRSSRIRLTVSAETLLGVREHAADLDGWGPITASHARRLAVAEGATWQRILTDPVTGSVVDVGRTRYLPPTAIADHVLIRDGGPLHPAGLFPPGP